MTAGLLAATLGAAICAAQTGPPPPRPRPPDRDPQAIERRIGDIRARLDANPLSGAEEKEMAQYVRQYLDQALKSLRAGNAYQARCFADAADACRRPIDHLRHIGTRTPAPPPPGPGRGPDDHLGQVYFRLRLADVFFRQIPPPAPKRLARLAREFYERAVRAKEQGDALVSDEYTKAADDLTHALESLAQAYAGG
jgi:hypothetical protein